MPKARKTKRDDPASRLNPTDPGRPTVNPDGTPTRPVGSAGKEIAKAIKQEVARDVRGPLGMVASEMRVTQPELEQMVSAIMRKMIKVNNGRVPQAILDVVKCMIMPSDATKARIPDGKARSTGLCCTSNIFPVVGNFAAETDDADKGRFCWSFTPTPLNFDWTRYDKTFRPITYDFPGGPAAATWFVSTWSQCSFAAEMDPERKWDPINAFIIDTDPPMALGSKSEKRPVALEAKRLERYKKFHADLPEHVQNNPRLRCHKPAEVYRHYTSSKAVEKCRTQLNSKLTPQEKDRVVTQYEKHRRIMASIEASPYAPAGWILYADSQASFVAGTGNVNDNTVNSIDATYEFTNGVPCTFRPVAMSVHLQNIATEFQDGGSVACSYLASDEVLGNIIPQDPGGEGSQQWFRQGPLANWERHAGLPLQSTGAMKEPATSMNGPFHTGSYGYWKPDDASDYKFRTPVQNATTPFPIIVVAGQISSSASGGEDPGIVAELKVNTVYEYTTDIQGVDTSECVNIPGGMEAVAYIMRKYPTVMTNGNHEAWWKVMLKTIGTGIGGFLVGGPAGAAAAVGGYLTSLA